MLHCIALPIRGCRTGPWLLSAAELRALLQRAPVMSLSCHFSPSQRILPTRKSASDWMEVGGEVDVVPLIPTHFICSLWALPSLYPQRFHLQCQFFPQARVRPVVSLLPLLHNYTSALELCHVAQNLSPVRQLFRRECCHECICATIGAGTVHKVINVAYCVGGVEARLHACAITKANLQCHGRSRGVDVDSRLRRSGRG